MNRKLLVVIGLLVLLCIVPEVGMAQCAMCKGAAEASLKQGGGDPQGLNLGILYMFSVPYLLVGGIGYWWYRNRRKDEEQVSELSEDEFADFN